MLKNGLNIVLCLVLCFSAGCGSNSISDSSSSTLNGEEYTVTTDNGLSQTDTTVSGNGTIIFNNPLSSIGSKKSYSIEFYCEDGGSLTLSSHASSDTTNGLEIEFSRTESTLYVFLKKGTDTKDISASFSDIQASEIITVQCDVHNDEVPAHILIWTGSDFSEEAAIFNSEDTGNEAPGNGAGTFVSLILDSATVYALDMSDAKFTEN